MIDMKKDVVSRYQYVIFKCEKRNYNIPVTDIIMRIIETASEELAYNILDKARKDTYANDALQNCEESIARLTMKILDSTYPDKNIGVHVMSLLEYNKKWNQYDMVFHIYLCVNRVRIEVLPGKEYFGSYGLLPGVSRALADAYRDTEDLEEFIKTGRNILKEYRQNISDLPSLDLKVTKTYDEDDPRNVGDVEIMVYTTECHHQ